MRNESMCFRTRVYTDHSVAWCTRADATRRDLHDGGHRMRRQQACALYNNYSPRHHVHVGNERKHYKRRVGGACTAIGVMDMRREPGVCTGLAGEQNASLMRVHRV